MNTKKVDKFLTKLLKIDCYYIKSKNEINDFNKKKGNFLLVLKTSKSLNSRDCKNFYIRMKSKLITFKRKNTENKKLDYVCRFAKKKDFINITQICRQNPYGSRFEKDPLIEKKFLQTYRSIWLKNFYKKKRGDYLIVAYKNNILLGFILLIKELKNLRIDQILVNNNFKRKGVAKTLINFTSNFFQNKFKSLVAGTYDHNLSAKKMYKKMNFKREKIIKNIYHLYPKNYN